MFGPSEKKGLLDLFLANRKLIEIQLPYYAYIRGKVFLDDLRDNYGEEVPYSLDIAYLIFLLYSDFLTQLKKGLKHEDVGAYLVQRKEKYFNLAKKERRVMKALTKHLLEFDTLEEDTEIITSEKEKTAYIELTMAEGMILRGEVLIHDLQPYLKGFDLSVEQLITIVYMDFISSVRNEGNSLKVQKTILSHLNSKH